MEQSHKPCLREVIINLIFQGSAESQVGKQVVNMLGGGKKKKSDLEFVVGVEGATTTCLIS